MVVSNRVKWPQEYVLAGSKMERIQFDQLSLNGWLVLCRIMKEETNLENKD